MCFFCFDVLPYLFFRCIEYLNFNDQQPCETFSKCEFSGPQTGLCPMLSEDKWIHRRPCTRYL